MLQNKKLKALSKESNPLNITLDSISISTSIIKNPLLSFSYAASGIGKEHLRIFQDIVESIDVNKKVNSLLNSDHVNKSENSAVNHHKCRDVKSTSFYQNEYNKLKETVNKIREESVPETLIQIGIGGSFLGPQMCIEALKPWAIANAIKTPKQCRFISNVDPDHVHTQLEGINLKKTLFIVVSKSGTTQETLANFELVKAITKLSGIESIEKQCIGITCKGSLLETNYNFMHLFYIDDSIGGRFSTSSVVGMTILALCYGTDIADAFLEGAVQYDSVLTVNEVIKNAPLLNACISIWFRNYCNHQALGVIPYNSALQLFPAFLQQLICESLGKQGSIDGEPLSYETSPIIFGEPGTNAQHSFFQMLHQGSTTTPLQFIGFKKPVIDTPVGVKNHTLLNSHKSAQIAGLAMGKNDPNINKKFFGNRPSTLIIASQQSQKVLGALLSFYENTVMYESFLLNINAFDQEGVQLGKVLANNLIDSSKVADPVSKAYWDLLNK
ncbi:glucose-6-phosphate isomerase [Candidatus Marinamargulisbacteria bacterium SCGC AAA071-K20]|nr:glucose-6-phosphate isomerase [Candidatus Marinamargulisbacteria bacterium SCGC AAA071-K20]